MFKRVGSIVLTVVMMLTMVCSTFALDNEPLALAVRVDGNVTEAEPGDTVTVYVDLTGTPGALNGITVHGTYDTDVFELQEEDITVATLSNLASEKVLRTDLESDQIRVVWYGADNVTPTVGNMLKLDFTVKPGATTGNTAFSFVFAPDGMTFINGSNTPDNLEADTDYASAAVSSTAVNILPATRSSLLAVADKNRVIAGETVTVTVQVNDYRDDWAGLTIEGAYDKDRFELTTVTPGTFGTATAVPVRNDANGTLAVTWMNNSNVEAAEKFTALTLVFTAKAVGEASFNFSFKDGGVVSVGTDNVYTVKVAGTDYIKAAAAITTNVVAISGLAVSVKDDLTEVEEGQTVEITVGLENYADDWAGLTIDGAYDADLFELTTVTPGTFGDNDAIVTREDASGELTLVWINAVNVDAAADVSLATLVFTAKASGTGAFNFNFKDRGVLSVSASGEYTYAIAGTDYIKAADEISVEVNESTSDTDTTPNLTVGVTGNVTSVEKGETVTLTVDVNDYAGDWAGLTIEGAYDKDRFELTTVTPGAFGTATAVPVRNDANGTLAVTWMNNSNVEAAAKFTALTLVFTAKAAGDADFDFNFKDEGVITIDGNNYVALQPATDYVKAADTVSVAVTDSSAVTVLAPTVSIKENKTEVKQGETVTLIVGVENYTETLTGITIDGTFDADIFEVTEGSIAKETFNGMEGVAVVDAENDAYHVTFMGTGLAGSGSIKLFEVTLTAKTDATLGNTNLGISFKADGMADGNGEALDASKFDAEQKTVTVTIAEADAAECTHDWTGTPDHKDGTSGTASKHIYTCANGCGETKEEACSIETAYTDPTETEYGKITYRCDVCGYNETVDDPTLPPIPSGHTWSAVPTHKAGTTGAGSRHIYTCTDHGCNVTKEEVCKFTSEKFDATCGEQGHTTYTCKDCGYVYTDHYVPALTTHGNVGTRYYAADRYTGGKNGFIDEFCYVCGQPIEVAVVKAGQVFPDVSTTAVESAWYYDAVAFNKAFGIFSGDEKGNFNPGKNITRGQMVTVLGRMMMPEAEKQMSAAQFNAFLASQGSLTSTPSTHSLSDVSGMYYERYAKLLAKWGIVTGYTDGTFKGDDPITRQEMATLLKRFVEAYAGTSNVPFGSAATFADMSSVDAWAKANVQWAGSQGLFQGDANKNYNPHSNATRAEIAVVISRMLPVLDHIEIIRMTGAK